MKRWTLKMWRRCENWWTKCIILRASWRHLLSRVTTHNPYLERPARRRMLLSSKLSRLSLTSFVTKYYLRLDWNWKICKSKQSNLVSSYYWWLVRVTLVVAWWLFAPKFWEVVGTYKSLFCSKMNAASVVVTCEVVGTLNHYKMVKKNFELCALRGGGDIKTFRLSLAP